MDQRHRRERREGGVADINAPTDLAPAERTALEQAVSPRWLWRAGVASIVLLVVSVLFGAILETSGSRHGQAVSTVGGVASIIGLALAAIVTILREVLGLRVRAVARTWLRLGRCAWCGYDLRAMSAQSGGIVRCPECGGQWRQSPRQPVSQDAGRRV